MSLLKSHDMKQLVTTATHTSGHILDVIISRNSDNVEASLPITDYLFQITVLLHVK